MASTTQSIKCLKHVLSRYRYIWLLEKSLEITLLHAQSACRCADEVAKLPTSICLQRLTTSFNASFTRAEFGK